jgi:hypothetical protein
MSIRVRHIDGVWTALCAARSMPQEGDVYLDDGQHHALALKFGQDFNSEGLWPLVEEAADNERRALAEANNPNRAWWESVYGDANAVCGDRQESVSGRAGGTQGDPQHRSATEG